MKMEGKYSAKKGFSVELVVALSAILISTATLFVYIYQAGIMQSQQHTSVWPYVQWMYSNVGNEFYLVVENKGIGPALIKEVKIKADGVEMGSTSELFKKVLNTRDFSFVNGTVEGIVLSPGEKVEMFHIYDSLYAREFDEKVFQHNATTTFELSICYCSVYNDCWQLIGGKVIEGECRE